MLAYRAVEAMKKAEWTPENFQGRLPVFGPDCDEASNSPTGDITSEMSRFAFKSYQSPGETNKRTYNGLACASHQVYALRRVYALCRVYALRRAVRCARSRARCGVVCLPVNWQ